MSGTEDSIINSIPDFRDGGDSEVADSSTTTSTPPSEGQSSGPTTSAPPTQTDRSGGTTQQPAQQRSQYRTRKDGLLEYANTDNPNVRDLVDPVTGRVVAHGGIERRVFEDGQRAQRENNQLRGQLQQATFALQGISDVTREAAKLNIAPEHQITALRVMSDFLADPVRTVQYLVEEVKSKGYRIPFLEQGVTQGMDMNAIARMIDTKLQPFTSRVTQEQQNQQFRQQAERDLSAFIDDNGEAQQNLDVLAEMLQADPRLTLHAAYTKMIRWSHENGLDWTQPLKPQVAALQNGGQQQPTHQQTQQPTRPLPGGRSVRASDARPVNGTDSGQAFNENASWADIIRSAMHDSGVQIN